MCDKALKLFEKPKKQKEQRFSRSGTMFYWFLHENIKYTFRWTRIGPYVPDGHALWCTESAAIFIVAQIYIFVYTQKKTSFFLYCNTGRRKINVIVYKCNIFKMLPSISRGIIRRRCVISHAKIEKGIS